MEKKHTARLLSITPPVRSTRIAARKKIVEGAVGMVDDALIQLNEQNIVDLDEDKKAAMVSNLLVVLCSDKAANKLLTQEHYTIKHG